MSGFGSFLGNERTLSALQQMLAAGRLPHAVLLEGEEGLGKLTLARIIAKALVCGEADPPCGKCGNCHLADIGSHPDITVVENGGKQITVGQVREAVQNAFVRPNQAKRRVFIFTGAESINEAGQNAILKTLEEPPEGVHFLLLCSSKSALLETVVSRCTVFSLIPPALSDGVRVLTAMGFEKDAAESALEQTAGNIGQAAARLSGDDDKVKADTLFELFCSGDTYGALLLLKKLERNRSAANILFEKLALRVLCERRNAALDGDSQKELYLRFMGAEVENAAECVRKNGNLSLIFHNLCLKLV